ncbi:MAG: tyrosine-type recombinase/integrase [Peptococcaceae bacterium]|nr:tyrosine-type recombinase/integrase [Peptococcaceae bacterium]
MRALDEGQIKILPEFPKQLAQQDLAPKSLTRREQRALARAVERYGSPRDKALIQTMLGSGLRVSEIARLERQDVIIRERSGKIVVRAGKGMKYREVPIGPQTRKVLKKYFDQEHPGKYVFPGRSQVRPVTVRAIQYVIKKYADLAKLDLKKLYPHILRHTFAKNLIDNGVDLVTVATLLGHRRLETTMRYTRPRMEDLQRAVDELEGE